MTTTQQINGKWQSEKYYKMHWNPVSSGTFMCTVPCLDFSKDYTRNSVPFTMIWDAWSCIKAGMITHHLVTVRYNSKLNQLKIDGSLAGTMIQFEIPVNSLKMDGNYTFKFPADHGQCSVRIKNKTD